MDENGHKLLAGMVMLTDEDALTAETVKMLRDLGVIVIQKKLGRQVELLKM